MTVWNPILPYDLYLVPTHHQSPNIQTQLFTIHDDNRITETNNTGSTSFLPLSYYTTPYVYPLYSSTLD